ncbi:MAG TPA: hypothetical protein VK724_25175 [Bryobacteraceae bacterium]|nr:hypothetical protein [Bryobacteraceae bacterium]
MLRHAILLTTLIASPGFSQKQAAVFVAFDHVARPAPSRQSSESALLWLRLKNNSSAPIQVLASAPEAGADGVELVHEIILEPSSAKPEPGWISPPEHYSPVNEATTVDVQPAGDLLFSVPLNHVGPRWRLRIAFIRSRRQPQGTVDFTWADVPPKERSAWKK